METERRREFIIKVAYFAILAAFCVVAVKYVVPMLAPFVLAFIVAALLRRHTNFVSRTLHLPQRLTAFLMVLLVYATIGVGITLAVIRAFYGICALIELMPHIYTEHIVPDLTDLFVNLENLVSQWDEELFAIIRSFDDQFMQWLGAAISGLSAWALAMASGVAGSIPGLFIKLVLMIISTFFIAMDYEKLTGFCVRQLPEKTAELFVQIRKYLVGTLFVCIGSYAIIMSLTFVELSIGLTVIGVKHALLIAGVIAVFDILPVLGTGGIMIPWGLITLLGGDVKLGVSLLTVYLIITVIRNIVEPKIVGGQLGLHPVVTLACMFAGVQLMGGIGLFGFPIGLSLLLYLNRSGTIHILKKDN